MCGIVLSYTAGKSRASKRAFRRYELQKNRGKEGYGCVSVAHGKVNKLYRSEDENGIRQIFQDKSDMVLFHHRNPTSTPNYKECTHPIFVSNDKLEYDYYVTHNGVIENCSMLKIDFEKLGFAYTTELQEMYRIGDTVYEAPTCKFNDSESFAIDLCIAIEEGKKELKSRGAIAFVALQVDKNTKQVDTVFFGRNSRNPLVIENNTEGLMIASQGVGTEVEPHRLHAYDVRTKKLSQSYLEVGIVYSPPTTKFPRESNHTIALNPANTPSPYYDTDREIKYPHEQGYSQSYHATHDIMRNAANMIAKGRKKKKKKGTLEEGSVTTYDRYNVPKNIKFLLDNNKLLMTDIDLADLEILTNAEWEWYNRVMQQYKETKGILYAKKKGKTSYNKQHYANVLRSCNIQFNNISDMINARGYRKVERDNSEDKWVDIE